MLALEIENSARKIKKVRFLAKEPTYGHRIQHTGGRITADSSTGLGMTTEIEHPESSIRHPFSLAIDYLLLTVPSRTWCLRGKYEDRVYPVR